MLRKKDFYALALAALLAQSVLVSAEEVAPQPTNHWKSSVYGGFSTQRGNTTETAYRYGGELESLNETLYRYKLKLDGKYKESGHQVADSKAEASGEMRRMFDKKWFSYGTLNATHDDLKEVAYRVKIGPGLGYYFIDSPELKLDVSSGPLYVQESSSEGNSHYLAWQVAQGFDWLLTTTFRWWGRAELITHSAKAGAYTAEFKTGVESKMNDHLSLVLVVEDDYDSTPTKNSGVEKNDFEISTGLRYTF